MTAAPQITPETRVARLLEDFPALEEVLIAVAPQFGKLRNPVLRRTIARVTTLRRAAEVAGIPVRDLVLKLREAAGQSTDLDLPPADAEPASEDPAPWVDAARVRWTIDADRLLEAGTEPLSEVMRRAEGLGADDLGLIRSSFKPAPLIGLLHDRGFRVAVVGGEDRFACFVGRRPPG